jgi:phage repressor protein C with HTH and peptisase S24 domain
MKRKSKRIPLPEWALQITSLRERMGMNQAELARRIECSAMTISRWERGLLQPSAEHFIQLGNLGDKTEAWFFWEMAGIQPAKMAEALSASLRSKREVEVQDTKKTRASAVLPKESIPGVVRVPILKAGIGSHGVAGDRRSSLRTIPTSEALAAPAGWCPNPAYTSLLRVKGRSMEPLIRNGDILAIDSFQTDRRELHGNIVVAVHEEKGMCVSRLRRYDGFEVLEAEDREFEPVVLNKNSGWRIIGKVLWWISGAVA